MNQLLPVLALAIAFALTSCSNGTLEEKGFPVSADSESTETDQTSGLSRDSLKIDTRPSNVLLTGVPHIRLTTLYKVNVNKDDNSTFIGSNSFHYQYEDDDDSGNNWNNNLMPGLKAVYGYNLVNVSHYDITENIQKTFFEDPVLIKTLYYPSFSKDTLNNEPVSRNYFLASVYNEDTNKDHFINLKDLRRLYLFDIHGVRQKALVPENYSVFKSEYDSANDLMFVFAQLDSNANGQQDENEPIHIFWIDLKDPANTGRQY
jgi:hypothetical protein